MRGRRERGVALLAAVLALMLLSAIGLAMMFAADLETTISSNFRDLQDASNAASAGLEEGRERLRVGVSGSVSAPAGLPSYAISNVIYILNPLDGSDTVAPWDPNNAYFDTEFCQEKFLGLSGTPGVPCTTTGSGSGWYRTKNNLTDSPASVFKLAPPLHYKWIRINAKANNSAPYYAKGAGTGTDATQICWNSNAQVMTGGPCSGSLLPVYEVTSLAVTPNGSRRMGQVEITQDILPSLPAALVLDGIGPTYGTAHSSHFGISGIDNNSCGGIAGPSLPAIDVLTSTDDTNVTNDLFRPNNYPGVNPAPDVEVASTVQLGPYATIPGIVSVVQSISSTADYVGPSPTTLGTTSAPKITVITGNYSSGCTGAGILVVTGNLTCSGNWSWYGTMLILGGTFQSNGGGHGEFLGNMLLAKAYNASHTPPVPYVAGDSAVPNYPQPGSPTWDWNGGGGNGITYDSCWTNNLNSHFGYRILSRRELNY